MQDPSLPQAPRSRNGCAKCGTTFSLFVHKHTCHMCRQSYCWKCSSKKAPIPHLGELRPVRICDMCFVPLCVRNEWWREVEALPTPTLKAYLSMHGVDTFYGMQKSDLIDKVKATAGVRPRAATSADAPPRSAEARGASSSPRRPPPAAQPPPPPSPFPSSASSSSSSSSSSSFHASPEDIFSSFFGPFMGSGQQTPHARPAPAQPSNAYPGNVRPPPAPQNNGGQSARPSPSQRSTTASGPNRPATQATAPASGAPATAAPGYDFTRVRELTEEETEYVRSLPIRQLKTILHDQKCGDSGCIEKSDLIDRVLLCMCSRGWKGKPLYRPKPEHESGQDQQHEQRPEQSETEADVCKICYDREINCVFLECGHLCSCVECGRQMKDCPICRRPISRVVEIFKS